MSRDNQTEDKNLTSLNRTEILRAVVADAESMGLRDRDKVERLTSREIERLEQPQILPGMEHLVPKRHKQKHLPTDYDIHAMVREILAGEELTQQEEANMKESTAMAKSDVQLAPSINLTENALHVLERRYLKKDKQGQVIETPEEMFHRVARAIASAELIYSPKADVRAWEGEFYRL